VAERASLIPLIRRVLRRKPPAGITRDAGLRAYAAEHARAITGKPPGEPCGCGWPAKPCLRVILRNGPPFPEPPCEPERKP
jgi:hypothetical protein